MSGSQAVHATRDGVRVKVALLWTGVGVAPLAILLLMVGDGDTSLRVAAVLTLLSVVLIGVATALRRDPESVRTELAEAIHYEIEALREQIRRESADPAARRSATAAVGQAVVDQMSSGVAAVRGVVRHTEMAQVITVDPTDSARGTVYGATPRDATIAASGPTARHGQEQADRWTGSHGDGFGERGGQNMAGGSRWNSEDRWSEDRWGPEIEDTGPWRDHWEPEEGDIGDSPWSASALPIASTETSWSGWEERSPVGRRRAPEENARHRHDY